MRISFLIKQVSIYKYPLEMLSNGVFGIPDSIMFENNTLTSYFIRIFLLNSDPLITYIPEQKSRIYSSTSDIGLNVLIY